MKEKKTAKTAQSRAEHLQQHKGVSLVKRIEGKGGAASFPKRGRKG